MEVTDVDTFVARTKGVSPAFVREAMRKAALFAVEEDSIRNDVPLVKDEHLDLALRELALSGGLWASGRLGFGDAE